MPVLIYTNVQTSLHDRSYFNVTAVSEVKCKADTVMVVLFT